LAGSEATLLSARGDILRAQGDAEAAEQDYRRAIDELDVRIKERPHSIDAPTMWLMGWCWLWLGDDDLAFRLLAHAKSLKPDLYIVRFFLALALLIRGQLLQARREYETALKTIEGKPPLLRRGILRSSLYALRVAREQQEISPENTAERVALDQQQTSPEATAARIVRDLEKELDRATAEIDSNIPKHSAPFLESRPKKPGILVEGDDLGAEPDSAPHINLLVRPTADPTVPMIRLDNEFKILDWNIAASLAFDGTLEDRRGEWVGNWILQHFDNPLTVAEHGQTAFGNPNRQPLIDVEQQHFTRSTYGGLDMTKRAYRIPNDDGSCLGWVVIFEVRFGDPKHFLQFRKDLIHELNQDNVWSEHALSYDAVLSKSLVYDELLRTLIGEIGPLQRIPDGARVLDLGAGTGGLTLKLATTFKQLYIVAVDNNSAMLDILHAKCRRYLHAPRENHGVVAIRQDVTKLSGVLGVDKDKFDFAFLVNVLNTLSAPVEALRGVFDLLKPGGEIRITGPRHDSKIAVLFDAFKKDLEQQGLFEQLRPYYEHLRELNERQLSPTFQWTVADIERMLVDVGFSKIIERGENVGVYAGQSMLIAARR
jgi:SAM-dependent methyltransferase